MHPRHMTDSELDLEISNFEDFNDLDSFERQVVKEFNRRLPSVIKAHKASKENN